jgi:hypothetical protein
MLPNIGAAVLYSSPLYIFCNISEAEISFPSSLKTLFSLSEIDNGNK